MEANHRVRNFELSLEDLQDYLRPVPEVDNTVPCNGCTVCCKGDAIRLLPQDDLTQYQTVPHDLFIGQRMLAHKDNGDCVYLATHGCSIHHSKPTMCKEMDCRRLAKTIKKRDLKRYNIPLAVWNRGRHLIHR